MGVMCSWIAVQSGSKADILAALNLSETGEEVLPGEERTLLSCCAFPGDWLVVFSEDFDWATSEQTAELSRFGLALGCQYEDEVEMTSAIWAMRDGAELWRVFHDNTQSTYRLDVTGDPPAALAAIRDRYVREQDTAGGEDAGVDYIGEIAQDLSKALCGFRMYKGDDVFNELRPPGMASSVSVARAAQAPRRPGLLARLFGRR